MNREVVRIPYRSVELNAIRTSVVEGLSGEGETLHNVLDLVDRERARLAERHTTERWGLHVRGRNRLFRDRFRGLLKEGQNRDFA
jgi:hypothetical protein